MHIERHAERDVDLRLRGESGHGRAADVLDAHGDVAERSGECAALTRECARPRWIMLGDHDRLAAAMRLRARALMRSTKSVL